MKDFLLKSGIHNPKPTFLKILIIRFSSIGDIVLTSPVLRCIKNQMEGAEIHFLTKKNFLNLVEFNPNITKILTVGNREESTLSTLKNENYDLIIDLHKSLRSRWFCFRLNKPTLNFNKENFLKWVLVQTKRDYLPNQHLVDRYFEGLKPLGIRNDNKGLDFFPCDCEKPEESGLPMKLKDVRYAVFSIGGTHFTKRLPPAKWIELLDNLNCPVVIVGGKAEYEMGKMIAREGKRKSKEIWNSCGSLSIGGSAHIIKESFLVFTNDTGMMHMAAAFKKPVVAIWGNTTPKFGMYPYKTPTIQVEVEGLGCRPCSKIGHAACPKGHFKCMNDQDTGSPQIKTFISEAYKNQ